MIVSTHDVHIDTISMCINVQIDITYCIQCLDTISMCINVHITLSLHSLGRCCLGTIDAVTTETYT